MGAWNVCWPIELISFVSSNNKYITLINNNNLALTYLLIKYLKTRPFKFFKIIKCVLVKFCKVKQFLWYFLVSPILPSTSVRFIYLLQVVVLLLRKINHSLQILNTVVRFLIRTAHDTYKVALIASKNYLWALILMSKQFFIR